MLTPGLRPEGCLSDLAFDEWRAGEIDARRAEELERHVVSCNRCRARRAELAAAANAFLNTEPGFEPPRAEPPARSASHRWAWTSGAVLAAAAALALLVWPAGDPPTTRSKGGAHVGFFVKRGEQILSGADGQHVSPGDQLRFVVSTPEARHLAIVSRDAAGTVSVYYPDGPTARRVGPGREIALDSSVELDATLGEETVFAVFCDEPLRLDAVTEPLRTSGVFSLPAGCTEDRLRLLKERAP